MNPPHRIGVTLGEADLSFEVFSTTLDTLLAARRLSSVELATVPLGAHEMVRRYAQEQGLPFQTFPYETTALLENVKEVISFTDMDDENTKHMVQIARQRGLPVQVILVDTSPDE